MHQRGRESDQAKTPRACLEDVARIGGNARRSGLMQVAQNLRTLVLGRSVETGESGLGCGKSAPRMAAFQTKFPGGHFDIGDASGHHEHAPLTWVLVQADGSVFAKGHGQIRVSQEGKIVSLIAFPPSTSNP